jgi:predicted dehydrogenase
MEGIFSKSTDDEVYSTLRYADGPSVQLSVNWSDESYRKMSVKLTIWGSAGRIYVDRQECQVYLRDASCAPAGYGRGWNVRYTTELTEAVWFYLRGEEYSAQIDHFVRCILEGSNAAVNSFAAAAETDHVLSMIRRDAATVSNFASTPSQLRANTILPA